MDSCVNPDCFGNKTLCNQTKNRVFYLRNDRLPQTKNLIGIFYPFLTLYVHYLYINNAVKMQQTLSLTRMNASSASPLKRCGLVVYLGRKNMKLNLLTVIIVKSMATFLLTFLFSRTFHDKFCKGKRRKAYKYA